MAKPRLHPDVAEVLLTERRIHRRIATLAREIAKCYSDKEVTIITVLNGSMVFLGELLHRLPMPTRLDSIVARSYGARNPTAICVPRFVCVNDLEISHSNDSY